MGKLTKTNLINAKGIENYKKILFVLYLYKKKKIEFRHLRHLLVEHEIKYPSIEKRYNRELEPNLDLVGDRLVQRVYKDKYIDIGKKIKGDNLLNFYLNQLQNKDLGFIKKDNKVYSITEEGETFLHYHLVHFLLDKLYPVKKIKNVYYKLLF